jgi:hypothetical protein
MAACAHVWHYKCISRLLHQDYPMFQCPNCRAFTDLSAEVDDSNDVVENEEAKGPTEATSTNDSAEVPAGTQPAQATTTTSVEGQQPTPLEPHSEEPDFVTDVENLHLQDDNDEASGSGIDMEDGHSSDFPAPNASNDDLARSATISIPGFQPTQPLNVPAARQPHLRADTPGRSETSDDNPLTPRNDSGPLAFDGRAGMQ